MGLWDLPACLLRIYTKLTCVFCFGVNVCVCVLSFLCCLNARSPSPFLCVMCCRLLVCALSIAVYVCILVYVCQATTYKHKELVLSKTFTNLFKNVGGTLALACLLIALLCKVCLCLLHRGLFLCACFVVSLLVRCSFPVSVSIMFLLSLCHRLLVAGLFILLFCLCMCFCI